MSRTAGKVPLPSQPGTRRAGPGTLRPAEVVGGERREQVLEMADLGPGAKPGCVRLPRLVASTRALRSCEPLQALDLAPLLPAQHQSRRGRARVAPGRFLLQVSLRLVRGQPLRLGP